jgi:hypothetical protein
VRGEWEGYLAETVEVLSEVRDDKIRDSRNFPMEARSRMIEDPNGFKTLENYVPKVKPEFVYFYEEGDTATDLRRI